MTFKTRLLTLALSFGTFWGAQAHNPNPSPTTLDDWDVFVMEMNDILNDLPGLTDDEYRQRLDALSGEIDYRFDPMVKERIIVRVEKAKTSTERLLGRAEMYFPIFEEHLAKYNVPHHIKYLSIIESHLEPRAKSPAGAGGLWQFIPSTAKLYGMQISATVDERSDTYKASESAAKMLSELYQYYGDWALALAAYNCGAGRINSAIKQAGSRDYWKVRNYLPYETQKYVPYFMAMVYAGEYASLHELTPEKQHTDLVLTDTVHLSETSSFAKLAEEFGVGIDTIKMLNPSYLKGYIPRATNKNNVIILPARAVAEARGYSNQFTFVSNYQAENPLRAVRRVFSQTDLEFLAKAFRCTVKDLLAWNGLAESYQVKAGDLIGIRKFSAVRDLAETNTARRPERSTNTFVALTPIRVTGLNGNKAVIAPAFAEPKFVNQSPITASVAASTSKSTPSPVTIASEKETKTTNTSSPISAFSDVAAHMEGDMNTDRTRQRRLRAEAAVPTPTVMAAQTVANQTTTSTAAPAVVAVKTTAPAPTVITPATPKPTPTETTVQKTEEKAMPRTRERNLRQADQAVVAMPTVAALETPAAVNTKMAETFIYHLVEPEQTIWDIRKLYPQVTSKEILEFNKLRSESDLHAGLILKIPAK